MALATTSTNLKVQTGNRIIVEAGGVQVGLCQSIRMADSYGLEDASGIGNIHVIEHIPTKAVHTVAVTAMVLFVGNLRDQGISVANGDAALLGIVLDFVVYSRDTGQALRSYRSCSYDSGTVSVEAHRILVQDGQFKALDVTGAYI